MTEAVEDPCCFICNSSQVQERERISIFGVNAVLASGMKLSEAVSQIVGRGIDPIVTHSSIVCKKCYKTCEEYDEINKRLSSLKSKMSNQFRQRLPGIHSLGNEMDSVKEELYIKMESEEVQPPTQPMKSLVLSKSKMTPIPNVIVKSLPGNKPISLKNCIFVSPNKATAPGTSLIKRQSQTNTSQISNVATLRNDTTTLCAPSTSTTAARNLPVIKSASQGKGSRQEPIVMHPDFHNIFESSMKMPRSSPVKKKVQNATFHFQSEELQNNDNTVKRATNKLVQSSNTSEQKSNKFVISEVEIMQDDNEEALGDDGEDTILMDQSGAILRVVRKDQDKLLFPHIEQVSLVMPEEQEIDSDTNQHFEIECQDSNDDTHIEFLEDAAIDNTAAKEKGITYIKMQSNEMYSFKTMQSNKKMDTTINCVVDQLGDAYRCLLCRNSSKVAEKANSESADDALSGIGERDKDVTFEKPEDMMMHVKKVHHIRVYFCPTCGLFFKRRVDLSKHINEEHCTESATGSNGKEEGISKQNTKADTITNSNDTTIDGEMVKIKQTFADNFKLYVCQHCSKKFVSRNLLEEHMNVHTGARPYTCNVCDKRFASKYTCKAHIYTHMGEANCNETFYTAAEPESVDNERPRPYNCTQCSKSFLTFQNLNQHIKTHSGLKEFHCKVCNKAYSSQHSLDVHGIVHSGKKPFVCGVCKKGFARHAEIRDHLRTHTGERPFECDICTARFAQRSNLLTHRRTTHMDEKRYACDHCDKRFKRKRLLDYHIKSSHTGERPYKCGECAATFVYPEHYKKHLRIHTGHKPFVCEVCNRAFNSRDNRNAHRFIHSNKKPYECLVCGAGFMRKPLLYSHMNAQNHLTDMIVVNQARLSDDTSIAAESSLEPVSLEGSSVKISTAFVQSGMSDMINEKIFIEEESAMEQENADETIEMKTISLVHSDVGGEDGLLSLTGTLTEGSSDEQGLMAPTDVEELLTQGSEIMTTDEEGNIVRLIQIQLAGGKSGWVALES